METARRTVPRGARGPRGQPRHACAPTAPTCSAYAAWLAARDLVPEDATRADLRAYAASLGARGLAPSSRARALSAVRALHRRLADTGVAETDPAADLPGPRRAAAAADGGRASPTPSGCSTPRWGDEPLDLRDHALLELLYGCGLRAAEACALDRGDVTPARGARARQGRAGARSSPSAGRPYEAVAAWLARGRPELADDGQRRRAAAARAAAGAWSRPPSAARSAGACASSGLPPAQPARAAPRLRDPHAGARRRPACDPGTPRA